MAQLGTDSKERPPLGGLSFSNFVWQHSGAVRSMYKKAQPKLCRKIHSSVVAKQN